jgi:hypothetical protein
MQDENIEIARKPEFAIDFSAAVLDDVGIRGEEIVPYVRFARNQAVILSGENIFDKAVELGRAEKERSKGSFFFGAVGAALSPDCTRCINTVEPSVVQFLPEFEEKLKSVGIEVTHYPLSR